MKKIRSAIFTGSLALATAACSTQASTVPAVSFKPGHNSQILGTWDCSINMEQDQSKFSIESQDTYVRNGRMNSFGIMSISFSNEMPAIEYSLAGTAEWEVEDGYLITTVTDLKITNLTDPALDKIFNLQDFFPKNMSDSSEIIELSSNRMILRSETDNQLYECSRDA